MSKQPCDCGNGFTVILLDGTVTCSHTLDRYLALHGNLPAAWKEALSKQEVTK